MSGFDEESVVAESGQQSCVDLYRAEAGPLCNVIFGRGESRQPQERGAVPSDHEAELCVEERRADRTWTIGLGDEILEARAIKVVLEHAMAVVVDEFQIVHPFKVHGSSSVELPVGGALL